MIFHYNFPPHLQNERKRAERSIVQTLEGYSNLKMGSLRRHFMRLRFILSWFSCSLGIAFSEVVLGYSKVIVWFESQNFG